MNTKFKRALSSVLAFIMLFSCMTVMNVSSVWAAEEKNPDCKPGTDTNLTAIGKDLDSYDYYFDLTKKADAKEEYIIDASTGTSKLTATLGTSTKPVNINGATYDGCKISGGTVSKITDLVQGDTVVIDLYVNNSSSNSDLTFQMNSDTNIANAKDKATADMYASSQVKYVVGESGTLYFRSSKEIGVSYIAVKSGTAKDGKVSYTVKEGTLGETKVTVAGAEIAADTSVDALADTEVVITATPKDKMAVEVTVNGKEVTLTGGSYTFKVNGNAEIVVTYSDPSQVGDCEFWIQEQEEAASYPATYSVKGNTVTLYSKFSASTKVDALTRGEKTYSAMAGTPAKATANGADIAQGAATIPDAGNAFSFTAGADGTVTFYGGCSTATNKGFNITDGVTGELMPPKATNSKEIIVVKKKIKKDQTYYLCGNSGTGNSAFHGLVFVKDVTVNITGKITMAADATGTLPTNITFKSAGSTVTAPVSTDGTYTVELATGTYAVSTDSTDLMVPTDKQSLAVTSAISTFDIEMVAATAVEVTGEVVGLTNNSNVEVSFTKDGETTKATTGSDGKYTVKLLPGTYTVSVPAVEGYTISSLSQGSFVVKFDTDNTAENWKNILYKKSVTAVTSSDVYVGYPDKANNFATITEAMDAINASSLSSYTVHIASGTYQEQVIVKANNVKFVGEGNVTIQWYYGIGYKYYSSNGGYYDREYAVDKHAKGIASRWGTVVRVTGSGFTAENITFKNTFNEEVTDAEKADGVALAGVADAKVTTERTADGFDAKSHGAVERAAAIALDGSQASLYNCTFISVQDTVYTGSSTAYFKDCNIKGRTDFIFGDVGKATFDKCTLDIYGDADTPKGDGYLTATRGTYVFRNATITSSSNVNKGVTYYGRPWAATSKVTFMNTETNGYIHADGWTSMSGVNPTSDMYKEYGNTSGTAPFKATISGALTDADAKNLAAEKDYNFFGTNWVPYQHVAYVADEYAASIYDFKSDTRFAGAAAFDDGVLAISGYTKHDSHGIYIKPATVMTLTLKHASKVEITNCVYSETSELQIIKDGVTVKAIQVTKDSKAQTDNVVDTVYLAAGTYTISVTNNQYLHKLVVTPEKLTNIFEKFNVVPGVGKVYVVGKVLETALESADSVGFGAGLSAATALTNAQGNSKFLETSVVATQVADGETVVQQEVAGSCFAAFALSGGQNGATFYVVPFTTFGSETVYGDAVECTYSATTAPEA